MNVTLGFLLLWGASIVLLTWTLARAGARSRQADEAADAEYRKQAEARVAGLNEGAAAVKEAEMILRVAR